MASITLQEIKEKGIALLKTLNFNFLNNEEHTISNPFSLIHPGFLIYIWGKLLNSNEKYQNASEIFNNQIQKSLDVQNYADAGEFAILRLKAEGHISPKLKLKTSYKKAKKILQNLTDLFNDAYYISSLIEVEELYEKYSDIDLKMEKLETLYRKASFQYNLEGDSIIAIELVNIKIMNYFEAANFLNKINKTLTKSDIFQKETIVNKMITEILMLIERQKKMRQEIEEYSKINQIINLEFGLGKGYSLLNKKSESKLFYGKALRRLDKLINDENIIQSLIKSRDTLYKDKNHYKIQNIKIFSQSLFEKIIVLNEKLELFDLRLRILMGVEELEKSSRSEAKLKVIDKLITLHLYLVELFENELNQNYEESIATKYQAFIIYLIYQVYKLIEKKR